MIRRVSVLLYDDDVLVKKYNDIKAVYNSDFISLNVENAKLRFSKNDFIRENDEYKFLISFKDRISQYLLKSKDLLFDINVLDLKYDFNNGIIEYYLDSDEHRKRIEIVEVS